jgi:hypothetical protein
MFLLRKQLRLCEESQSWCLTVRNRTSPNNPTNKPRVP